MSPQSRSSSTLSPYGDPPPRYHSVYHGSSDKDSSAWNVSDPRFSSTQSLGPADRSISENDTRRRLLLIYIHGFMGDETSFRSFPAHVHNLLVVLLSTTHVVHTKIYPRYRSKHRITVARDAFSQWLEPHEDNRTDVILLGHSMGGLLSAEVALQPFDPPSPKSFKHRIIGTINFDVPFLGMHPGIVKVGLSSIFKPSSDDEPADQWVFEQPTASASDASLPVQSPSHGVQNQTPNRQDTLWTPTKQDPNFDPSFQNDVVLPMRKGWRSAWHFINKHSDQLVKDTKKLVASHVEFGGAMAHYNELKLRYTRIRALEEDSGDVRRSVRGNGGTDVTPPRVRFVNYYTESTGRVKKEKPIDKEENASHANLAPSHHTERGRPRSPASTVATDGRLSRATSPRISVEEHSRDGILSKAPELPASPTDAEEPQLDLSSRTPPLPPPLDISFIHDPELRRTVKKEHERAVEAHEAYVRKRESLKQTRRHTEEPSNSHTSNTSPSAAPSPPKEPTTHEERERRRLEAESRRMKAEARRLRADSSPTPSRASSQAPTQADPSSPSQSSSRRPSTTTESLNPRPPKFQKFCVLPPKDSVGQRDPCWIPVRMDGLDAVSAHTGLFFVGERYERLVGEVAERVEKWLEQGR